jgi:restriction system protein
VADTLDDSSNLAAMDWEDFEHLIRELFEKEFSTGVGEVKITQASRDGGVDAVVFDPDPIRGGKIVIQAKRYTNTVSVSAVRDTSGQNRCSNPMIYAVIYSAFRSSIWSARMRA